MGRPIRIIPFILFATGGILALELPARANSSISMLWDGYPSIAMGKTTFGIAFVAIVLVEALVISAVTRIGWKKALWISIAMNSFSTVVGMVLDLYSKGPGCLEKLIFILVALLCAVYFWKKRERLLAILVFVGIVFGLWYLINWYDLIPWLTTTELWLYIYFQLAFGFILSIALEFPAASELGITERTTQAVILANLASYAVLAVAAPYFWPNPIYQKYERDSIVFVRKPPWHERGADSFQDYSGSVVFEALYRASLTTPEILGIQDVKKPVKPLSYRDYSGAASAAIMSDFSFNPNHLQDRNKYIARGLLEFIDLAITKVDLHQEEESDLQYFKTILESWPEMIAAMDEDRPERFRKAAYKWNQRDMFSRNSDISRTYSLGKFLGILESYAPKSKEWEGVFDELSAAYDRDTVRDTFQYKTRE